MKIGIFSTFFANFISFLLLLITAQVYGAEGRGYIALITSIAAMLGSFFCFSLGRSFVYFIVKDSVSSLVFFKENFFAIIAIIFFGFLFACLFLEGSIILQAAYLEKLDKFGLSCVVMLLPSLLWQNYANYFYIALHSLWRYNLGNLFFYGLLLILCIFLYERKIELHYFLGIYTVLFLGFSIIQFLDLYSFIQPKFRLDWSSVRLIKASLMLHIDVIGFYLFGPIYILVVAHYLTLSDVGIYQLGVQLCLAFTFIPKTIEMFISQKIANEGVNEGWQYFKSLMMKIFQWLLPLILVGSILFPYFIPKVFGAGFINSGYVLDALLVPLIVCGTFVILINPFWVAKGFLKELAFLTTFIGGLSFLLSLYLVPKWKIWGAVFCLDLNYACAFLANACFFYFMNNKLKAFKEF